ncbi:putative nicotinamide phosphoribosyl transferase [Staphylococcus phage BT3]|nr:putative nicotinamide phosphoribosyl transferase [Staphylococcus phage BT3]WPH66877.1 nicotinamide phosphoribosyltransferase [Staphylococcus phage CUB-A]
MLNPTLMCDFYKLSHREQYPEGTEIVYSTLVPRSNKYYEHSDNIVVFGIQSLVKKYFIDMFNKEFFNRPKEEVINEYKRTVKFTLGHENPDAKHLEQLHDLGYLPIDVRALKEGTVVHPNTPVMTIENTHSDFFWLTNYLETIISTQTWQAMTSATLAYDMRKMLDKYALETVGSIEAVDFQGHDFSMRGMSSLETAQLSSAGHAISFKGSDTVPVVDFLESYYNADVEKEMVVASIPATEHSVMCANGDYETMDEYETYKRMLTEIYPTGVFSIVSDTWDFWGNMTKTLPRLKDIIMERDGKVVIRPDSGDPVKIICGDPDADTEYERKGAVEVLWDTFGGTETEKGYKVLDEHVGLIYGDSINYERAQQICEGLKEKGFASINVVLGVGSFSYQFNTRDTHGFAIKATYAKIKNEEKLIYKNPKTDSGKRSHKGRVAMYKDGSWEDNLNLHQWLNKQNVTQLERVFEDGKLYRDQSLSEIREIIKNN